jgi:hypothetical protein
MKQRAFSPGFRLSILDSVILAAGIGAVLFAPKDVAIVAGMAVGHFFFFCNVFRMSRKPELIWASVFVALSASTLRFGVPQWPVTIGLVVALAVILIAFETRKPGYHGVGWRTLNPNLPEWWRARNV